MMDNDFTQSLLVLKGKLQFVFGFLRIPNTPVPLHLVRKEFNVLIGRKKGQF